MAKRRVENFYFIKKWTELIEFIGEDRRPTETDYLQYFDHPHTMKKLKASANWLTYSSLNSTRQLEFAEKLQVYPRVTPLLKTDNNSHTRKVAFVF